MTRSLRMVIAVLLVLVCSALGCVLGYSTASGGLENYYERALVGGLIGLGVGVAITAIGLLLVGKSDVR